jgi:hypothetical protein
VSCTPAGSCLLQPGRSGNTHSTRGVRVGAVQALNTERLALQVQSQCRPRAKQPVPAGVLRCCQLQPGCRRAVQLVGHQLWQQLHLHVLGQGWAPAASRAWHPAAERSTPTLEFILGLILATCCCRSCHCGRQPGALPGFHWRDLHVQPCGKELRRRRGRLQPPGGPSRLLHHPGGAGRSGELVHRWGEQQQPGELAFGYCTARV